MRRSLVLAFLLAATPCALATPDTVTCTDGTTSTAGRGACTHHGGVTREGGTGSGDRGAARARESAPPEARGTAGAAAPAPKTPTTGVGTPASDAQGASRSAGTGAYSHSRVHSGACSHHGGVAQWLDGSAR